MPIADENLKSRVVQVLKEEVAPVLQMDGGDVEVLEIRDGIVRVRIHSACRGCPSTIMAVIMGVEQELRKRIPEVEYLEAVP